MSTLANRSSGPPSPIASGLPDRGVSTVQIGLAAFGVVNLALAAMLVFAPHAFFEDIGPYGAQNDHYMRDVATFYAAFAVACAVAYRLPSWRTPVLCCMALQSGLHTLNHLADIGKAHTHWLGPANFGSLALATGALVWLTRESLARGSTRSPQRPPEVQQ